MSKDTSARALQMKSFEQEFRQHIPAKSYAVIRVDGRAFHTLTRGMKKPFDLDFMAAMDAAAVALCEEIQGAQFAYVQSDEISVLVTDFGSNEQQWFGGELPKWLSISASVATWAFARHNMDWTWGQALFDSRVITVPDRHAAINYFLWRQADCARNAIQAVGQAHLTKTQMHKANLSSVEFMLDEIGVYMGQYPATARMGRIITRLPVEQDVTFTHGRTGEVHTETVTRHFWQADPAPWFDWDQAGFLEARVPHKENVSEQSETAEPVLDERSEHDRGDAAPGSARHECGTEVDC